MSAKSLIQDQVKMLENARKRFNETQTAATLDKLLSDTAATQKKQIKAWIARLERQKVEVVAKIDAAIAREKEALKLVQKQVPDIDLKPGTGGTGPTRRTAAATKKSGTASKSAGRMTKGGT